MSQQAIDLTNLEPHPFAELFPMLGQAALGELADAIRRDGLLHKVVIFQGRILDGRNRYAALRLLSMDVSWDDHFSEFAGAEKEALDYVESSNLHRRHLNQSQRALAAAEFARLRGIPSSSGSLANPATTAARDKVARQFGTTLSMMSQASAVANQVTPNVTKLIHSGALRMRQAERIAKLPPREQKKIQTPADIERVLAKLKPGRFDEAHPALILRTVCDAAAEARRRPPLDMLRALQTVREPVALHEIETAIAQLTALHDMFTQALADPYAFRALHTPAEPASTPDEAA